MTNRLYLLVGLLVSLAASSGAAQPAFLVKDIRTGTPPAESRGVLAQTPGRSVGSPSLQRRRRHLLLSANSGLPERGQVDALATVVGGGTVHLILDVTGYYQ